MSGETILELEGFGVSFGEQVVLASIDLKIEAVGLVSLVGEAGTGKSTLLRTLAGLNDAQPALQTWGKAIFDGQPLGEHRPALVQQKAKLLTATIRENLVSALPNRSQKTKPEQTEIIVTELARFGLEGPAERLLDRVVSLPLVEQRALAIVRASLSGAPMIFLDEPTAQLDDAGRDMIVDIIAELARTRAVVLVTHNQRVPRQIGGRIVLLAGGRVQETRRAESFFANPTSLPAQSFVRTGRCAVPSPMARREDLRPSAAPPPPLPAAAQAAVSRTMGPRDFYWLFPGELGGLPRPGIVRELDGDLEGLTRVGVTRLVTLEENATVSKEALERHDIEGLHFPIVDMRVPSFEAASSLCRRIEAWITLGEIVAVHCRAGLGRTGTILVLQLIWRGTSALEALERARGINPRWVQSEEQVSFLSDFERWVSTSESRGSSGTR